MGMYTGAATMENSTQVLQNIKNRATIQSRNFTSGYFSEENKKTNLKRYLHPMFIAAVLTIAKRRKQPKFPSRVEWIKRIQFTHTMEYYLALRKNLPISDNIDEPRGYYAKWNKFDREKQIPCDFTRKWNLKTKQVNKHNRNRSRLIYKDCQRAGVCFNRRWVK